MGKRHLSSVPTKKGGEVSARSKSRVGEISMGAGFAAVLSAFAEWIGKPFVEKYLEASPRDLVPAFLCLMLVAIAIVAAAIVWRRSHSWWMRVPSTIGALIACAILGAVVVHPVARILHAWWDLNLLVPPDIKVNANLKSLKTNDTVTIKALNGKDPIDPSDANCEWKIEGVDWTFGSDCSVTQRISLADTPSKATPVTVEIKATVSSSQGIWGNNGTTITLEYAPTISLDIAPSNRVWEGQDATLRAELDNGSVPSSDKCVWTVSEPMPPLPGSPCQIKYPTRVLSSDVRSRTIEFNVEVFTPASERVGRSPDPKHLTVSKRDPDYTMFLLDASKRMQQSGFWDDTLKQLRDQIQSRFNDGRYAAVQQFGASTPESPAECANTSLAVDFDPSQMASASDRLDALKAIPPAPLFKALPAALERLAVYRTEPSARLTLIMITGGLDNCPDKITTDAVSAFMNRFNSSTKGVAAYVADPKSLKLWLVVNPPSDQTRDVAEIDRQGRAQQLKFALLTVFDRQHLNAALDAAQQVTDRNGQSRQVGCEKLKRMFNEQSRIRGERTWGEEVIGNVCVSSESGSSLR